MYENFNSYNEYLTHSSCDFVLYETEENKNLELQVVWYQIFFPGQNVPKIFIATCSIN